MSDGSKFSLQYLMMKILLIYPLAKIIWKRFSKKWQKFRGKIITQKNLTAENPTDKWMARSPRQKAYHSQVWRIKSLLKNSVDRNSDNKELLRINLIPKISTAESLKVKSPATAFSPTQRKTANTLVTNSLKMKYPKEKSPKKKKIGCKKPLNRKCSK